MDTNTEVVPEPEAEVDLEEEIEAEVVEAERALVPVALHPTPPPAELDTIPGQDEFRSIAQMALLLSQANLVPAALRRKPHDVFLVLLTGRDLGVPLTTALREAYVIDGKVTVAPALRLAKVRQMGLGRVIPHPQSDLTNWGAMAVDTNGTALGPPIWFGWEDAQIAGLVDEECHVSEDGRTVVHHDSVDSKGKVTKCGCKTNWRNYPQRMLWWRAAGYAADDYFPEAGLGIYSPDEIGAVTDAEGRPVDVTAVELPAGWERPGAKAEPMADEETIARLQRAIGVLTDDEKVRLRELWSERGISPLSKLPEKSVVVVEALIGLAARSGGESAGGQGEASAGGPDPLSAEVAATEPAASADDAADAEWTAQAHGGPPSTAE